MKHTKLWFWGSIGLGALLVIQGHLILGGLIGIVVPYYVCWRDSR